MNTAFLKHIIWQIVASIPEGKVATYGQVASLAGYPKHARLVGSTMKALPVDTDIPWHRVMNTKGMLSFPIGSEAFLRQKKRLEKEGVVFQNNKISLKSFQWNGEAQPSVI